MVKSGFEEGGRWLVVLACLTPFGIAVVVLLSHTLFTLFGCSRCKHKRLVTAIYQKGAFFVFMMTNMLDLLLATGQNPPLLGMCFMCV